MKGMILAAGLGTRLKPFTDASPKALYPVGGMTLLEHAVNHLKSAGITDVIINVHHFADQIIRFILLNEGFGMNFAVSDERGELLETGGGVKKAAWFFHDPEYAVVRNVDVLSDLDLNKMAEAHRLSSALATLAVRDRVTNRYFLFDERMRLCGWENRKTGEKRISAACDHPRALAFSGIQILDPSIFPLITEEGKFSLTSLYLRLARNHRIEGYLDDGQIWEDAGKQ